MASQVQIPFEGVILQEHSAPISCSTPNFAKGSLVYRQLSPVPHEVLALSFTEAPMPISNTLIAPAASEAAR